MANREDRWADNVSGRYYVDHDCVVCTVCSTVAPEHFRMSSAGDHYVVMQQPRNELEQKSMEAALDGCPMDAVGDDGQD